MHERHGAVVDQHVLEAHLRVVLGHPGHHLPPQLRHDQHVGLVHRGQPLAPLHGHVEGGARDPLDLPHGVGHRVHRAGVPSGALDPPARLAEVEPAGELADDHEVGPLDHRPLERRGVHQHREAGGRPQVGEEIELLADGEQPALRPSLLRHAVPLRAAHRSEEDRVGRLAEGEAARRERPAGGVDGGTAHQRGLELEPEPGRLRHRLQHALRLGSHLLPDAVTGQHRDLVRGHTGPRGRPPGRRAPGPGARAGSPR